MNLIISVLRVRCFLAVLVGLLPFGTAFALSTNITVLPAGYSEDQLHSALGEGGTILFSTNAVFQLTATISITNDVYFDGRITNIVVVTNTTISTNTISITNTIDGTNTISSTNSATTNQEVVITTNIATLGDMVGFSGPGSSNSFRLFEIATNVNVTFDHIQFVHGGGNIGGAISNAGALTLTNAYFSNNRVRGKKGQNGTTDNVDATDGLKALGGALFNTGTTLVQRCDFAGNEAIGGQGGLGHNGASDSLFGKAGGRGGNGGMGLGGAIYNSIGARLEVTETTFSQNGASGGDGGFSGIGGSGPVPGTAGDAGVGGSAYGGAIYNVGTISNAMSLYSDNFVQGGNTMGQFNLKNGVAGGAAGGGALFNGKTLLIHNSTITSNLCLGGAGGGVQAGDFIYGGRGGAASGGGIFNNATAHLTNCTFAGGTVSNGLGGVSLNTDGRHDGPPGVARGGNLYAGLGSMNLLNCIVAYGFPSNSFGVLYTSSFNLSSDRSCVFKGSHNLRTNDVRLKPLADNGGATLTMALGAGSLAINRGTNQFGTNLVPIFDQRGTNRLEPFDIGAFESVGPFTISGRVTFGTNRPIANVVIDVTANSTNVLSQTNDAEGNFSFILERGTYSIVPHHLNTNLVFKPASFTNEILSDIDNLNFKVDSLTVRGYVTNKAGIGMNGVTISTTNAFYDQGFSVTSGIKGIFLLTDMAIGSNLVSAVGSNAVFLPSTRLVTNSSTNKINFLRIPTYNISGVVTGKTAGISWTNVPVVLTTNTQPITTNDLRMFTDFRGRFTFSNVITGTYSLGTDSSTVGFKTTKILVASNILNLKLIATNIVTSTNSP